MVGGRTVQRGAGVGSVGGPGGVNTVAYLPRSSPRGNRRGSDCCRQRLAESGAAEALDHAPSWTDRGHPGELEKMFCENTYIASFSLVIKIHRGS